MYKKDAVGLLES